MERGGWLVLEEKGESWQPTKKNSGNIPTLFFFFSFFIYTLTPGGNGGPRGELAFSIPQYIYKGGVREEEAAIKGRGEGNPNQKQKFFEKKFSFCF